MEPSLRPVGIDGVTIHHRNRSRPFVKPEVVAIRGFVGVPPDLLSGLRIERLEDFLVVDTVEQQHASVGDRRAGETFSHHSAPEHLRPIVTPLEVQRRARVQPIAARPEKLRPLLGQSLDSSHTHRDRKHKPPGRAHRPTLPFELTAVTAGDPAVGVQSRANIA